MIVYWGSWCQYHGWCEDYTFGVYWTTLHRKIWPQWCWLPLWFVGRTHFSALAKADIRVSTGDASVSLYFLLYPSFYRHHDFCVGCLGAFRVSLLLGYCQTSSQIGLGIQLVWVLQFYLLGPNGLLYCDHSYDGMYSVWFCLTRVWEEMPEVALWVSSSWRPLRE